MIQKYHQCVKEEILSAQAGCIIAIKMISEIPSWMDDYWSCVHKVWSAEETWKFAANFGSRSSIHCKLK